MTAARLALLFTVLFAVTGFMTSAHPRWSNNDWPAYLHDAGRSSYASQEALITPVTVSSLRSRWQVRAAGDVSDEPVVSGSRVFWGSWDGLEHATSLSGSPLWTANLGTSRSRCSSGRMGVASTATVAAVPVDGRSTSALFVAGGNAHVYALNAQTGHTIWSRVVSSQIGSFAWSSPLVYGGSVYIGLASVGDCPLVQGKFFKLNAQTGAVQKVLDVVPDGCMGASVWSSPTFDAVTDSIYFTTGNGGRCAHPEPLAEAMVEVKASSLTVIGSWQIPPAQAIFDSDFGSTPTLFSAHLLSEPAAATPMVGAVNKNGIYYAFRRDAITRGPAWEVRIGHGGTNPAEGGGDISPSAFAEGLLFIAGGTSVVKGQVCAGTLRAVNPANGRFRWQRCLPAPVLAAVILGPGYVVVSCGDAIIVSAMATGKPLLDLVVAKAQFFGPASIASGMLYQGDMNGRLLAFGL